MIRYFFTAGFAAFCLVFVLGAFNAMAASADSFEPDNGVDPSPDSATVSAPLAKPIVAGVQQSHSLDTATDRDFVKFTIATAQDILVQTDSDIPDTDTRLRLFDNSSPPKQLAINDDIADNNYLSRITLNGLQAGTYYISVEQYGFVGGFGQVIENYKLTLLTSAPGQKFAPIFTGQLRADGVAYAPFKFSVPVLGTEPIALTATGLPTGVQLIGNTLTGVPTAVGTFDVAITATGAGGNKTQTITIDISAFGVITTIMGDGNAKFSGDGELASQAQLIFPQAVALGKNGDVLIVDSNNNRVRKIDGATGVVATLAGGGTPDPVNDGDPAAQAIYSYPSDMAIDSAGNIYIADSSNYRIRKITASTGIVSTIAGNGQFGFSGDNGPATSASFGNVFGIAVDTSGNVYIADGDNNRVRKVAAATGVITTVAGNGTYGYTGDTFAATSATLASPQDIVVASNGDIFISDSENNVIRKVTVSDGKINTIAGNGTPGYSGDTFAALGAQLDYPNGLALDSSGNLYIADFNNSVIRKITGLNIDTVAGDGTYGYGGDTNLAVNAQLNQPYFVTVAANGDLYIADTFNNVIRKVNKSDGKINTIGGSNVYGFSGDNGPALSAKLGGPNAIVLDSTGGVIFSDSDNNRLRRIASGTITTFSGGGFPGDNKIGTAASLNFPTACAADSAGNVYITDFNDNRVRKVDAASGKITTIAGNAITGFSGDGFPAIDAGINGPVGITVDSAGNVFFSDYYNNRIRKIDATTGKISTFAGGGVQTGENVSATTAALVGPTALAVDSSGILYLNDSGNDRIRKINTTNQIVTVAGTGVAGFGGDNAAATAALLDLVPLSGIAVDSSGNLFIADTNNNRIRRVAVSGGKISTVAGNGLNGFAGDGAAAITATVDAPTSVAVDATGYLFITDSNNVRVRKVGVAGKPAITSPLTDSTTTDTIYTYRISATGHPAAIFSATGLPPGLVVLTSGLITGIVPSTAAGAYDISLIAINSSGKDEKTLRLIVGKPAGTANNAAAFSSGSKAITAVPNPAKKGSLVSFVAPSAADGDGDQLVHTWDFGDGSEKVGTGTNETAQHLYAAAGLYTVTCTINDWDTTLTDVATIVLAVNEPDVPVDQCAILKCQFKLDFTATTKDSLAFSGALPLRKATPTSIKLFIGDIQKTLTPNGKSKTDTLKIKASGKLSPVRTGDVAFNASKFSISLKGQNLHDALNKLDSRFQKNQPNAVSVPMPIMLSVDGDTFIQSVNVIYSSKNGKGTGKRQSEGSGLSGRSGAPF
jgi:sugar lactone lactonase YvrE